MKRFLYAAALLLCLSATVVSCNKDSEGGSGSTNWSKIEKMVVGSKWTVLEDNISGYYEFPDKNCYRYYLNLSFNHISCVNGIVQASKDDFTYMATVNLTVKEFFTGGSIIHVEGVQVSIIDNDTIRVYSSMHGTTVDLVRIKGFLN